MSSESLATRDAHGAALAPMSVKDLLAQVSLIQEAMKSVMKPGEHYGTVPGCGDKKALFKSGAEKLCFLFRLAPSYAIEERSFDGGHREYRVKCSLRTIGASVFIGEGEGVCSTLEGKYRYRSGPKEPTGKGVPQEYWTLRATDPSRAQALLGGPGFSPAKNEAGQWEIMKGGGAKVDHDNPADYYNTALKMAQKRAHVAATLTATAASDIFTQDIDDLLEKSEALELEELNGKEPAKKDPTTGSTQPVNQTGHNAAQSTAASNRSGTASESAWRKFITPKFVKKHAGKPLGEMDEKDLGWWGQNYVPKPFGNASAPSAGDLAFRKALDEAISEMRGNAHDAAQKVTQKLDEQAQNAQSGPQGGSDDGDVPY